MPAHRYGVLGAGRQGTAAAYDLVARGGAVSVVLADADADADIDADAGRTPLRPSA